MVYSLLADAVVIIHFLFIVFALLGGLLVLWRRRLFYVHIPAALWAAAIECWGWACPLTPLENHLRAKGERPGYEGGFIEHYLLPVIYPAGLSRDTQFVLGGIVVGVNIAVYLWVWRRHRAISNSNI